ncbi:MAG TPA: PVC-type heme-binding CxxCH protein [Methylomirabilota bacterium]|nr:PVC-type heme-binding CxxCH protein [Methylomirabilota bacterium]
MKRFAPLLAALVCANAAAAQFKVNNKTFVVPEGFTVELAARAPLVDRPMMGDFDELGRLYVCDSSGRNDRVEKQLAEKPHRIVRLEDTNGDGVFDKSVVFADKMMFPEGALFYRGSLYVSAPPSIWKLTDTDADGVADKREEWMQGQTLTGCANDLHGPYLGPDGWIYWAKGAFAEQRHTLPSGKELKTRAAHIFRRRPEGGAIEPVMTGGMDNPVEVAFSKTGERFFTTTFFQHPGGGQRDGIIHAIYGGVYGKPNDAVNGHPRTGELMPVLTHLGPAAPSGLMRYDSTALGEDFQDNLFAALFNLRKVSRHKLIAFGASFKTEDSDFLTCDDPDFHPTDVMQDADGSLLIIDTGGWYKICCPTSQLAKPDVLGAIYRVRRAGAPKIEDPRGDKLPPIVWRGLDAPPLPEVIRRLNDPRPAVVEKTIEALSAGNDLRSVSLLQLAFGSEFPKVRRNAIWALTRNTHSSAREAVRAGLNDSDESVRAAATHSVSVWRDKNAVYKLTTLLPKGSPAVRRATAEALGRLGSSQGIEALFLALDPAKGFDKLDRALEHSIIYALIEIGDSKALLPRLGKGNSHQQRAALIALDQMEGRPLPASAVVPLLSSNDEIVRETAHWITSGRPEWGDAVSGYLAEKLSQPSLTETELKALESDLAQFAKSASVQELLARTAASANESGSIALRAMAKSGIKELPEPWAKAIRAGLESGNAESRAAALQAARAFNGSKQHVQEIQSALIAIAKDPQQQPQTRLDALSALPGKLPELDKETFEFLLSKVGASEAVSVRTSAAGALARSKLSGEQLLRLATAMPGAGPMETIRLLDAYEGGGDEKVGLQLASSLKQSRSVSALPPAMLKAKLAKFPTTVQVEVTNIIRAINKDAEQQHEHLEKLLLEVKGGDIRRGQAIFNSPQAACSSCHAMGYLGGTVGPDLTSIGTVRTERDLLESIVYPSASFVRSYEPMTVTTKNGDEFSGVLRKDSADEVILATGPTTEARIARADIAEMIPGSISTMPQGLDQQLTRDELADLLAFLKNTKWGAQ